MRIYLDVCCLCRPYDFQGDYRVRLESEAVLILLSKIESGELELIGSEVIDFEVGKIHEKEKQFSVSLVSHIAKKKILLTEKLFTRAVYFEQQGLKALDALHIACAEEGSDVFLSVDTKLLSKAKKIQDLKVTIHNALDFVSTLLEGRR